MENNLLRVRMEETPDLTAERIEIKDGTNWVSLLSNLPTLNTVLFLKNKSTTSKSLRYKSGTPTSLIFEGDDSDALITLEIKLISQDLLHYKYNISSKAKFSLSKLIAGYKLLLGTDPDFKWVPHLRHKEHYVMADHIFRSLLVPHRLMCVHLLPPVLIMKAIVRIKPISGATPSRGWRSCWSSPPFSFSSG